MPSPSGFNLPQSVITDTSGADLTQSTITDASGVDSVASSAEAAFVLVDDGGIQKLVSNRTIESQALIEEIFSLTSGLLLYVFKGTEIVLSDNRFLVNTGSNEDALITTSEPFVTEFSADGDSVYDLNSDASVFDWQFAENAGQLEVAYIGLDEFLTDSEGVFITDSNNSHIIGV
jgi:hypothetical protein